MNNDDNESIISHLEALRQTILKCVYAVAFVMPFAFFAAPKALNFIINFILKNNNIVLNYFSPAEVFLIQIKTAVVIDLIVCFPYIMKQVWDFILPALYENEKKFIKTIVLISSVLFTIGVIFCITMIVPLIIKFGISFSTNNIQAVWGISNVISLALWLSFVFGLMFQVPLITFYLIKSDVISYESIAGKRPYFIIVLLVISGILTPPDVVSQLMLALPTYLLFEAGLFLSKKRNKEIENTHENID